MPQWTDDMPGGGGKNDKWILLGLVGLGLLLAYICNRVGGFEMLDRIMGGNK